MYRKMTKYSQLKYVRVCCRPMKIIESSSFQMQLAFCTACVYWCTYTHTCEQYCICINRSGQNTTQEKKYFLVQPCFNVCVFYTGPAGFPDIAKLMCNYSLPLTTPTPSSHASGVSMAVFITIAVIVLCGLVFCLVMLVLKSVCGAPRSRPLVSINWFSNELCNIFSVITMQRVFSV